MTIIRAISLSLKAMGHPATYEEVYNNIVDNKYYEFGAKSPISVVRVTLRLHSDNIGISSGRNKIKYFHSEAGRGVNETFSLLAAPIRSAKVMNEKVKSIVIQNDSVIKEDNIIDRAKKWHLKQDWSIHKSAGLECICMLFGSFLPILVDSLLRKILLDVHFIEAIRQNLKSGEIFLLTSALIMPFCFVLISYMNSDDENKRLNKLPYFGFMFLLTILSLLTGVFTFVYYRIGQLVRQSAESDTVKTMFSFEFGYWSIFIFIMSLFVWYYSSYMNHRSTDNYKKIRVKQQEHLKSEFSAIDIEQVA